MPQIYTNMLTYDDILFKNLSDMLDVVYNYAVKGEGH